ncbi:aspartate kinase [Aquibacillus albus]|uniref:Aspartokinase n=1 Tax=Aquibacillus albus TaxID=1168171 RepID=A0ABS2MYC8_9BACI|nr:aspartate kinase [Aquibacillus albus]MBM7570880.1 aspartate kinase [Aquibacillus albus]
MGIIVQKYGGTSVGNVKKIKQVAERVKKTIQDGQQVIVVVSAMGDTTDELVSLMHEVTDHPPRREMDMMLTTGEQISIALLSTVLQELNVPSISYTGWQAGIETEAVFGNARILDINTDRIIESLNEEKVVIVAGFQGLTEKEEIATLGRGGSDTSAVALAAAVNADHCEINTDVDGVYSTDPRIVPNARKLPTISHDEMLEMAALGASVIHPRAVELAKVHGVRIMIRSSFSDIEGTLIKEANNMEKEMVVSGVAYDTDIIKIEVLKMPNQVGITSNLFDYIAKENINVDMIVLSEHGTDTFNVAFTVNNQEAERTIKILNDHKDELKFEDAFYQDGVAKVSIIGSGMVTNPGVAAKMFTVLSDKNIPIKMINTSEIKVSCVIPEKEGKKAVKLLHSAYDLDTENETMVEI